MDAIPRNIGIFGGTFDPVHNGHVSIAKSFLESGIIDALWVFLNPDPPHKSHGPHESYAARFRLLSIAFESIENVQISDLETTLSKPCYTIQTVNYLADRYPEQSFYLCMGKDSFLSFKSWYKWEEILNYCRLLVADRPHNNDETVDPDLLDHTTFVDHEPIKVSSTQIRKNIAAGKSIADMVPVEVAAAIDEENLYRN